LACGFYLNRDWEGGPDDGTSIGACVGVAAAHAGRLGLLRRARLKLAGNGTFRGSFFAESIEVGPQATVTREPFAAWSFLFPPLPLVACVARFDAQHANALWSYENPLDVAVTVPQGEQNNLSIGGQPPVTVFEPGRHEGVGWTFFAGGQVAWTVAGTAAKADALTSKRCAFGDLPPPGPGPTSPDEIGESAGRPGPDFVLPVRSDAKIGVSRAPLPPPVHPPPLAPPQFRFIIDDQTFGSDAACGPKRLYVNNVTVNGVAFPRRTFAGCTNPGACGVPHVHEEFIVDVPPNQERVSVFLELWEEDTAACGGSDDHILDLDLVVDNISGRVGGGVTTFHSNGSVNQTRFLEAHERCATGLDGFGICWSSVPTGTPQVCTAYNTAFADGGTLPGASGNDDFANTNGELRIPASFARARLFLRQGTTQHEWVGVLDENGCVPRSATPPAAFWQIGRAGLVRAQLDLLTEQCWDPDTGTQCAPDSSGIARGAQFRVTAADAWNDNKDRGRASEHLCTLWTDDPSPGSPVACELVRDDFPGWLHQYPPRRIELVNSSFYPATRTAAITSHMLRLEAEAHRKQGVGLGVYEALVERGGIAPSDQQHGIVELRTDAVCCLAPAQIGCSFPSCAEDGTCSACASNELIMLGPDWVKRDGQQIKGDSFWKYVVAHEIGHTIQRRAMGIPAAHYARVGGRAEPERDAEIEASAMCACDHVDTSNKLHCLQSVEEHGAANVEGFAQFFASRVWNRASDGDCTFKYYKEFFDGECVPGSSSCEDFAGGKRSRPPIPVSCLSPIRWRNKHCLDLQVGPVEAVTDFGTELDWMGFLYASNTQGSNALSMSDIFGVFRTACGASCERVSVGWDVCANCDTGVEGLRPAAELALDATRRALFLSNGDLYGISRATRP
jgi:hypothetical protein